MLVYLLLIGCAGGCMYILSLAYKLLFKTSGKRKIKSKKEFKKSIQKYETFEDNENKEVKS